MKIDSPNFYCSIRKKIRDPELTHMNPRPRILLLAAMLCITVACDSEKREPQQADVPVTIPAPVDVSSFTYMDGGEGIFPLLFLDLREQSLVMTLCEHHELMSGRDALFTEDNFWMRFELPATTEDLQAVAQALQTVNFWSLDSQADPDIMDGWAIYVAAASDSQSHTVRWKNRGDHNLDVIKELVHERFVSRLKQLLDAGAVTGAPFVGEESELEELWKPFLDRTSDASAT